MNVRNDDGRPAGKAHAPAVGAPEKRVPSARALTARFSHTGPSPLHIATDRLSPARVTGFTLYNLWLLSTFYNTFLFLSAPSNFREALYLNQTLSLLVLAFTLLALPLALKNADKWVLSRRLSLGAGAALALFTALLAFADPDTTVGFALIAVSSVGTGLASGALFLGWGRLYADVGARCAMFEIALSWLAAGLAASVLSLTAPVVSTVIVVAGTFVSAVLLRRASFSRPARPVPSRPHRLQRRTRRMFARGLVACAGMGLVAGFSDVLTGFKFVAVADHYEIYLALSCAVVAAAMAAISALSHHDFVPYAHRLTTLLLAAGCLLTPILFASSYIFSNVVIFGAYTGFVIVLSVVCIDISNYFDQPATRTFGLAFFALYAGELVGNGVGHLAVDVAGLGRTDLNLVALVLTVAIIFANLFLFTEKDLVETSLGEMTDDEGYDADGTGGFGRVGASGAAGAQGETAGETGGGAGAAGGIGATGAAGRAAQEEHVARVTALFTERFGLTPREAEVLPLIIKGRTIARIQEELHISQGTVSTHTRHIYQKTGAHNRQALLDMIDGLGDDELAGAGAGTGAGAGASADAAVYRG